MQNIQPVTSWTNGELITATLIDVISEYDDLATTAIFKYTLLSAGLITVAEGKLTMSGNDYQIWGSTMDVNLAAYEWVATKLKLVIDYTTTTTTVEEITTTTTTVEEITTTIDPNSII